MVSPIRRHLPVVVTAVAVSTVFAGGPTVAQAAYDALNADKVDGRHAVSSGASVTSRAGKLVATNGEGRLPNNIIAKAPDAGLLDGLDSSSFLGVGGKATDAELLDGQDSADFLGAGDKATDAELLDGQDSADFLGAGDKATDAELLDGLDSAQFDRPVIWGVESVAATLVAGQNFALGEAFTPPLTGMCLVMVSGQIFGSTTGVGPTLAIAGQRGGDSPVRAMYYSHYFVAGSGNLTPDMTMTGLFRVNAGEVTKLGAFVGDVSGDWVGASFKGHLTYTCSTAGVVP